MINADTSWAGRRVGRIHTIFTFTEIYRRTIDPTLPSTYLAYVEWFSKFPLTSDIDNKMFKITSLRGSQSESSIINVSDIQRSLHLIPCYGEKANEDWTSSNVLDRCSDFFVNRYSDRHALLILC